MRLRALLQRRNVLASSQAASAARDQIRAWQRHMARTDPIKEEYTPMRKGLGRILFTGTAAALAIGFGASSALATTATLTVKVTNGGTYTATSSSTVLTDNGVSVTCTGSTASGSIPTKTYTAATSPVKVGSAAALGFTGCTGPLGAVTVTVNALPYKVKVDSKTNASGQTDGMVTGVNTSVSMTGCTFTVTGGAPGFYTNSNHKLSLTPTLPIKPLNSAKLTVSNVNGCAGLVNNGDHPTYKSTYTVSRAIKINAS
jgi:hypothetical protein